MSYIFKATNPGATVSIWPQASWKMDRYFDKAGSLQLTISGDHGIAERAIVEAYYADEEESDSFSDIIFRGFVMPSDESSEENKLAVPAIEKMLEYRYAQTCRYPAGTTLTKILTHDWPAAGEVPGLLCQANNLVQQGSFISLSSSVWKLPQGGTKFLGDIHALGDHVYINSVQQTWGSSTSLTAGQYWQDADYLYIYSSKNPYYSLILVEGCYETGIRLGTISTGSATFTQSWRVGNSQISKEILRLLNAHALEFQYTYNADNYTYLTASAAIGRGANSTYYPTYIDGANAKIKKVKKNTTGGKVPLHALRGLGIGKGATRQAFTAASFPIGLRFVALEEYANQFYTQLAGTIGKLYADRQDSTAWEVEADDDPAAIPGDYVKIAPLNDAASIQRIKQISESGEGAQASLMKLYLGQRPRDAEDVIKAKFDVWDQLQKDLESHLSEFSGNGQENVDNSHPCKIKINIPSEDWDQEQDSKWLLAVTMNEFESSISNANTAEINHGSSGTSTKAGTGGSKLKTTSSESSAVSSDNPLAGSYMSVAFLKTGTPKTYAATPPYTTASAITSISGEWDGDGDLTNIYWDTALFVTSVGSHSHNIQYDAYHNTITDNHKHIWPSGGNATTVSIDGHGGETDAEAHTVNVNPTQDALLDQLILKKTAAGGASSWVAYLTVAVKIINSLYPSGVAVPGSPFEDVAIGDQLSDIDVTGLVVAGDNTVEVSISRYDTPGAGEDMVVAARASVTLAGKHFVDSYYI